MKKKIFLLIIVLITITIIIPKEIKAETYEGKYSIEYLLRNYNAVALGAIDNNHPSNYYPSYVAIQNTKKGDIHKIGYIGGAVLARGDYHYNESNGSPNFGRDAGNTKSFVKGTIGANIETLSQLATDPNYIDFDKMYAQVMNESRMLANKAEHHISNYKLEITSPGIYTIHNTAAKEEYISRDYGGFTNSILISNYDKNSFYVFNMFDEYATILPIIIMESGSSTAIPLETYFESGNYTGNIIWNFPNARYVNTFSYINAYINGRNMYSENSSSGNIIAPKADIFVGSDARLKGTIIANSICGWVESYICKKNYNSNKKILEEEGKQAISETEDYTDDHYYRDYSISDLLQNYNLVTLGHKSINPKSSLLQYGQKVGSIRMFHIAGQALISGDLYSKIYENERDEYLDGYTKFDRTAFDLESNEVTESYIKGNIFKNVKILNTNYLYYKGISVIQPWDNMYNDGMRYENKKNLLFIGDITNYDQSNSNIVNFSAYIQNYINFNRLYENVVNEQKEIKEGEKVSKNDGKAHIKIGGQYVIDDINDIDEIVFDNFDDNKNKLTIITIKNEGDINFPLISRDTGSYKGIVTNDYYGKEKATHFYEQNTFISEDSYHGNIIWNVPNATYIKLKENAPFAGHLIAPNADVDTPETHFSGCFIVNSIYGEGNTEAHFYPITAYSTFETPDYSEYPESFRNKLNAKRLSNLLGGEGTQLRRTVIGDETQLREETDLIDDLLSKEKPPADSSISETITQVLTNPATYRNIVIILLVLAVGITGIVTYRKKLKNN